MITHEEVFRIGRIGKTHGIKGEVTLQFSDDTFDRVEAEYLVLETEGILVPFFMEEYRFRSDEVAIVKFEGIDTEQQARELTHCDVFLSRRLVDTDADEISLAMLIGYTIADGTSGKNIGKIADIDDSTANVLFVVDGNDGNEILIPATDDFIVEIDTDGKVITMTLPEGLI